MNARFRLSMTGSKYLLLQPLSRVLLMAKGESTVQELIDQIQRNEIRLPEMQRQYVWKSTRVRDLFDSLYRGWPSGAILLWETDEDVAKQDFAVSTDSEQPGNSKLLLDGQQRLTSLSAVIRGEPVYVRGRKKPVELLFNLDHPDENAQSSDVDPDYEDFDVSEIDEDADDAEENSSADASDSELQKRFESMTFLVKVNRVAKLQNWVAVSDVFANDDNVSLIRSAGITSMDDPRFSKYNDRLNRLRAIKKYSYRLDTLERSLSYEEVTEIFVRVNSLGARLRSSDLALAQITATWRGSLSIFQEFEEQTTKSGLKLELGDHLRCLVVMATNQSRFRAAANINRENLESAWADAKRGTEFAVNFLKSNCGIKSTALLSSPSLATAVAYFGHKRNYELSPDETSALRRWSLLANAKGRYSRGSSETILDQDLATIRDGGSVKDLLDRLAGQVGRLEIVEEDLVGRNQRSSLFKTLFLALSEDGAQDWRTGIQIAIDHSGAQDRLQFHHIFPKDVLKGKYSFQQIDDFSNLAFIGGKTNRQITNKAPIDYLPELIREFGSERLIAHLVPLESDLLTIDNYLKFLEDRRKLITQRLNDFLNG